MKREDVLLAELQRKQERNQAIADKILRECNKRRLHVRLGVSSEAIRIEALDDRSRSELAKMGLSPYLALDAPKTDVTIREVKDSPKLSTRKPKMREPKPKSEGRDLGGGIVQSRGRRHLRLY